MTDMKPVLAGVNLFVSDMQATVAFYRRLGLAVDDQHAWGAHHVGVVMPNGFELEFDSIELTRSYDSGWGAATPPSRGVLVFSLPSREAVDELYDEMTAAGHTGRQPPFDAFWGARYAVVDDPDGNNVGLMSPIDPSRRSAPPAL
jgi:catechol 2,3-dioxygenase-like lactoylglutathione lyase family enzyme